MHNRKEKIEHIAETTSLLLAQEFPRKETDNGDLKKLRPMSLPGIKAAC